MDLLFHSDQGIEFKTYGLMETSKMMGVKQSFPYLGSPNGNACMEGFYSKLRSREINVSNNKYENSRVIKEYLTKCFDFYNNIRIHSANNGLTPSKKRKEWFIFHFKLLQ